MKEITKIVTVDKASFYRELTQQAISLIDGEHDTIANLANLSALLKSALPDTNWVGFYLFKNGELVLGPFQGNIACIRIPLGKGVCGTAAMQKKTIVVPDVHAFPGHIACDVASNAEIVVPILVDEQLMGVLDIDSPVFERFDDADGLYLEELVRIVFSREGVRFSF